MESSIIARFEPLQNRSELRFEAQSSLHPVHVATKKIGGYFEAAFADGGKLDLFTSPKGHLEIYVEDLKSGNNLIDRAVQDQLDERRYPTIKADIVELQNSKQGYSAVGDITFHGVTRRLKDMLSVTWLDQAILEIRGETTINSRDFKIEPPKLLMLTVEPVLKISLKLVMKRSP